MAENHAHLFLKIKIKITEKALTIVGVFNSFLRVRKLKCPPPLWGDEGRRKISSSIVVTDTNFVVV